MKSHKSPFGSIIYNIYMIRHTSLQIASKSIFKPYVRSCLASDVCRFDLIIL